MRCTREDNPSTFEEDTNILDTDGIATLKKHNIKDTLLVNSQSQRPTMKSTRKWMEQQ
jgi:hypothetical protein